MKKIALIVSTILLASCTQNSRVKNWGGTGNLDLPKGQKLVTVTWKGEEMWYLTRPMTDKDSAVSYSFREESSYGMVEGTFNINEVK